MRLNEIVLGLGDAQEPPTALEWAAAQAVARDAELHIVRVYHWSVAGNPWERPAERRVSAELHAAARAHVGRAIAQARRAQPDVRVTGSAIDGVPPQVLVEHSARAQLTVLGSRRLSAIGSAVLGSVSTVVAAAAHGPVVVVAGPPGDPAQNPDVVVGVDGSPESHRAVAFAFDAASRGSGVVRAVFAWRPDTLAAMQWRPEPPAPERADRWLAEEMSGWQEKFPDVRVHRAVVRDHPVAALVAESHGAQLLVVGDRSRHARVAAMLGSVSQGVLHHATCPVVVVHEE